MATDVSTAACSVKVALRVRPLVPTEINSGCENSLIVNDATGQIVIGSKNNEKTFNYDHTFGPDSSNSTVYEKAVAPLLVRALDGFNCTIFAYGQTGSGKTFTMMEGFAKDIPSSSSSSTASAVLTSTSTVVPITEHSGIAARLMEDVFTNLQKGVNNIIDFNVKVSCLEIYNENVYDLLSTTKTGGLQPSSTVIRENEKGETIVTGLTEVKVTNSNEMALALYRGMNARQTASTAMNERSSRSHAIFTMIIEQTVNSGNGTQGSTFMNDENMNNNSAVTTAAMVRRTSRIHLVDLAGSERTKRTQASGDRLREATNINKSLLALGNVIKALATIEDGSTDGTTAVTNNPSVPSNGDRHIPYRDSKLTRLLKDSLGGNAYTLMIACASPADTNVEETMSTLHYAARARTITNKAVINTDPMSAALAALRKQVKELNEQLTVARALAGMGGGGGNSTSSLSSGIVHLPFTDITNITLDDGSIGHATPCPCGRVLHIGCANDKSIHDNNNGTHNSNDTSHSHSHHSTATTLPPSATAAVSSAMQKVLTAESANRRLLDENNALKTQLIHVRNESNQYFDKVYRTETINDTLRLHLQDLTKAVRNSLNRAEQYKADNHGSTTIEHNGSNNSSNNNVLVPLNSFNDLPWLTDLAEKALAEANTMDNDDEDDGASLLDDNDDIPMDELEKDYNNLDIDLSDLAVPTGSMTAQSQSSSSSTTTATFQSTEPRHVHSPLISQSFNAAAVASASRVQAVRTELVAITDALQAKQRLLSAYEAVSKGTISNPHNKENTTTTITGKALSSGNDDAMQRVEAELNKVATALATVTAERNRLQLSVNSAAEKSSMPLPTNITGPTTEDYVTLKAQLTAKQNEITTLQNRQNELKRLLALRNKSDNEKARLVEDIQTLRQHKAVLSKSLRDEQNKQRLELKKAQAAAVAALREANKAQLEGLRMKTQLENHQIVMKRTMEEKAALQKRMKEQSGEIAQLRTAARAQALNTNAPMDVLNQQLVPYPSVPSVSSSSSSTAPTEILTCSTHDTFYAVAAAQAAVQGINGKGVLYSKQMHSSIAAAVRKGLIPAPEHNDDSSSSFMPMIAEELDEQMGATGSNTNNDEDHGVASVNTVPADGLISLADCFANVAAIRVPSTLRSLLEGDIAARVTLRRASTLAQKLASERKLLVTRKTQRMETLSGAKTNDSVVQALDTQIAVTTMQLNTVLDVIVTLKTQLQSDNSTNPNGTNNNRGIRARAKGWANEVTDIHAAKKTIKWLSYTATALADSCDVAVQEANLERVRADERIIQIRKEQETSEQLRRNAETLVRNQQAEIQFLLNQATQSVLSSVGLNDTTTDDGADTTTLTISSGSSKTIDMDTSSLTHLLRIQDHQLQMYKDDITQINDLRTKVSELETALEQTKEELRTVQISETEAKSALAAELYGTTNGSKAKANTAKTNGKGNKGSSNIVTESSNRTSLAMTEEEMQNILQTALSSKPSNSNPSTNDNDTMAQKSSRTSTGSAGTFTFNEQDQPVGSRRSRNGNTIVTYHDDSDSDQFEDEEDHFDDAGAQDDSEDEDFNESLDEDDYDNDNGKKKKKKNTTANTTAKTKSGKGKNAKTVPSTTETNDHPHTMTTSTTVVGKKRRASSTSESIIDKDNEHDHEDNNDEEDNYLDDDNDEERKPRKASKTNQGTRKVTESCKCKATKGACKNCACKKAGRKCGAACKCESSCCVNRDTMNDSSSNGNDSTTPEGITMVPSITMEVIPTTEITAALATESIIPTTSTTGAVKSTINGSTKSVSSSFTQASNSSRNSSTTISNATSTDSRVSIGSTKSAVSTGSATSHHSSKSFGSTNTMGGFGTKPSSSTTTITGKSFGSTTTNSSSLRVGSNTVNRLSTSGSLSTNNSNNNNPSRSISNSRFSTSSVSSSSTIRPSIGSTNTTSGSTNSVVRQSSVPSSTIVSTNGSTAVTNTISTNNNTHLSSTVKRPVLGTITNNKMVPSSSMSTATSIVKKPINTVNPVPNSTVTTSNISTNTSVIANRFSTGGSTLNSTHKPVSSTTTLNRPTTIR